MSEKLIKQKVKEIREIVRDQRAVVTVSGVDSSTVAKLACLALKPENLLIFTIDDGLRREGEPEWTKTTLEKTLGMPVQIIEESARFFDALEPLGPVEKEKDGDVRRSEFSDMFGKVCGEVAQNFGAPWAFFGTNALDLKETVSGAQKQHNAWEAMGIDTQKRYGFNVVEPIRDLFKEGIRRLARALGLPPEISEKMPFPGPGLGVRVLDTITRENVTLIRKATQPVEEELLPFNPFQCLACLLQGQATGLREDVGFFGRMVVVRAVWSGDSGQTSYKTTLARFFQDKITDRILSTIPEISRVFFDATPKPPGRIEYI